nr:MAG TPA: hypothetical protein [Caudoviricetes sp.]
MLIIWILWVINVVIGFFLCPFSWKRSLVTLH